MNDKNKIDFLIHKTSLLEHLCRFLAADNKYAQRYLLQLERLNEEFDKKHE